MKSIKIASSQVSKLANGNEEIKLSKMDWEKIGKEAGWMKTEAKKEEKESEKKGKKVNPWAVCHTTVDKDKEPEKYERCVKEIKEKQPIKKN